MSDYSYVKNINNNEFVILIEDEESFDNFDEIITLCQIPYEITTINPNNEIYEISINNKFYILVMRIIYQCKHIKVLQIKQ